MTKIENNADAITVKLGEIARGRKAAGLHVRVTTDAEPFDYYPANAEHKARFIRSQLARGRTILVWAEQ